MKTGFTALRCPLKTGNSWYKIYPEDRLHYMEVYPEDRFTGLQYVP